MSRSGIGYSVGIPGMRYGVNAYGKKYIAVGIPGLGIYYQYYFGQNTNPLLSSDRLPEPENSQKKEIVFHDLKSNDPRS
jgi:hypothetical protein